MCILLVYLSPSSFSFETDRGRYQWPFAGLPYLQRDFGLSPSSVPAFSAPSHSQLRALLEVSLLHSHTLQSGTEHTLFSFHTRVCTSVLQGWLVARGLPGQQRSLILDTQGAQFQGPQMSKWAVVWVFPACRQRRLCLSGTDGIQVWLCRWTSSWNS